MFSKILIFLQVLATVAVAVPAPVVEDRSADFNATDLVVRSGDHSAVVYSAQGCTGTELDYQFNFPCGGRDGGFCHSGYSQSIFSVLLTQAGTGNPKPTADFYDGPNCSGNRVLHAGIFAGEHSGCSDVTSNNGAKSFWLYFNC